MRRARRHRLIGWAAVFLLFWIGVDFAIPDGCVLDGVPIAGGDAVRLSAPVDSTAAAPLHLHDHCFCHAVSTGAVLAPPAWLAPAGVVARPLSRPVPRREGRPLDHPPHLAA